MNQIFCNENFSNQTTNIGKNMMVYRRSKLSQKLDTVYGNDNLFIVGSQSGNTQIIYPINGGKYKMGTNYTKKGNGTKI